MSRSNDYHWGICTFRHHDMFGELQVEGNIGTDGYCDYHRGRWSRRPVCKPARFIPGRRNWTRHNKWDTGMKYWTSPPPRSIKQMWNRKMRRIEERELRRFGELQTDTRRLLAGLYERWD